MTGLNSMRFLSVFVLYAIAMTCVTASPPVKGAYWPSWDESFPPSAIDTSLFTHVYYAFASPNNVTFKFDISNSTGISLLDFTSTLHRKKPSLKALLSIGGGGGDQQLFARMASKASTRASFIKSTVEVARKYGFDGLDLDWEFPESPKEMEDWGLLLQEWRAEVKKEAKLKGRAPLLITAATYFSVDFFAYGDYRKYQVGSAGKNLDLINLMCYDYRGSWDTSATGAQAALSKLVMGLPLYGRTWKLKDPTQHGIGAPAVDVGPGTSWIGYDDTRSTTVKIGFARALGLRGYFFWAVNDDSKWKISRQGSFQWLLLSFLE
ncbi:Chitotriosidase-1 [Vitis vinifera]|uniref:Chitotriosidase-1 n=1 Tax=Vitis vinifera TaxID=29760 RepID=A0A438J895_VITVI|nr:Chitotriosidase-1 [Vitis vinifera]